MTIIYKTTMTYPMSRGQLYKLK